MVYLYYISCLRYTILVVLDILYSVIITIYKGNVSLIFL